MVLLYSRNYAAGIRGSKSSDCFENPKKSYLNQATQKNTCQNFPTQENPEIENFKPQKPFDHPCHLKSGVQPPSGSFLFLFCQKMEFRTDFFFIQSLTNSHRVWAACNPGCGPNAVRDARTLEKLVTNLPVFEPTLIQLGPADSQQN